MVKWKRVVWEVTGVVCGTAIMAASLDIFLVPNRLAAGGISGLAVILFHLFGLPLGLVIISANIPLFLLAIRYLGWRFVGNSFLGAVLLSVFVELLVFLPEYTADILLAAIYGGIGMGLGLGIIFRFEGSTGGTATAAMLLRHFFGVSSGFGLIGSDLLIIALAGFVFSLDIALYAAISLFVSSKVVDFVQEGFGLAKAAVIISDADREIARRVLAELDRGATYLEGAGAYTGERRGVLLVVVSQAQVTHLKNIAHDVDPRAFIVVGSASEVLGEGFKRGR